MYKVGDLVQCNSQYGNDTYHVRVVKVEARRCHVHVLNTRVIDTNPANPYDSTTTYEVMDTVQCMRIANLSKAHGWSFFDEAGDRSSRVLLHTVIDPVPNPLRYTTTVYY